MRCLVFLLLFSLSAVSYAQEGDITRWQKRVIRKVSFDPKYRYPPRAVLPNVVQLLLASKITAYSDCWHTRVLPASWIRGIVYDTATSFNDSGQEILTPSAPALLDTADFGGLYIAEDITIDIETDIITVSVAGIAPFAKNNNKPIFWLDIGNINYSYPIKAGELLRLASYTVCHDLRGNDRVRQKDGTSLSVKGIKIGSSLKLQEYSLESTEVATTSLAERLTGSVLYFGLRAYSSPLLDRENRYKEADLRNKIEPVADTFNYDEPCSKGKGVIYREFCFSCVDSFNVLQKINRNENNRDITIEIKGIAPVYNKYDEEGNKTGNEVLFWLRFGDAAPLLRNWHSNYPLDNLETALWQQLVYGK